MDLVEGKKKGNVWKLESEAFKKPIEIKIWYDNHDIKEFDSKIEELKHWLELHDRQITHLNGDNVNHNLFREEFQNKVNNKQHQIDELRWKIEENKSEIKSLYKVIADLKTTVETLSGTILHLQEQTSLIQKKITKQPMVFHDKWFISWRESSGLWMINIPDGDYLLIAKYVVWEHNEYVTNQDEILMDKIHVEGQHYVPFYKLEWGTELDTPTATIYYDLVFMPI
jgi:hypothetical protein